MRQGDIIQYRFVFSSLVSDKQVLELWLHVYRTNKNEVSPESRAGSSELQPGIPPALKGCELEQPKALESSDEQLPHHQSAGTELPGLFFFLSTCSFESTSAFGSLSGVDKEARGSKRKST